jgi:acetate kinase
VRLLVVNTGSSSLKLQVLDRSPGDGWTTGLSRHVADWDGRDVRPVADLVAESGAVTAVGHRVVHGGVELRGPTLVDDEIVTRLDALTPLAPLHQQRSLAGIAAAREVLPDIPHVACFDTAYHATLSEPAATYALPEAWRRRWPLRRFGFHGLSHAYAARRATELTGSADDLRVVSCHLGAGASLCASRAGRSVDTTMGFTPLEGLIMSTRAGSVDPGLVLWLITEAGLTPEEVSEGLEHESGLKGLTGTPDMAQILHQAEAGDTKARQARDVYVHTLTKQIAAMVASLDGIDVLTFTGGIGENAPDLRATEASRLSHLGVAVDPTSNTAAKADADITAREAAVTTLVITAREDLEIAHQVQDLLAGRT